jgi:hypothetical protein
MAKKPSAVHYVVWAAGMKEDVATVSVLHQAPEALSSSARDAHQTVQSTTGAPDGSRANDSSNSQYTSAVKNKPGRPAARSQATSTSNPAAAGGNLKTVRSDDSNQGSAATDTPSSSATKDSSSKNDSAPSTAAPPGNESLPKEIPMTRAAKKESAKGQTKGRPQGTKRKKQKAWNPFGPKLKPLSPEEELLPLTEEFKTRLQVGSWLVCWHGQAVSCTLQDRSGTVQESKGFAWPRSWFLINVAALWQGLLWVFL